MPFTLTDLIGDKRELDKEDLITDIIALLNNTLADYSISTPHDYDTLLHPWVMLHVAFRFKIYMVDRLLQYVSSVRQLLDYYFARTDLLPFM